MRSAPRPSVGSLDLGRPLIYHHLHKYQKRKRSAGRMKAEHRKELETNVLAERMGRMVRRVRESPRRRTTLYVVGGIIVVVALYLVMNRISASKEENSRHWTLLYEGARQTLDSLAQSYADTNQGKAARFQRAWDFLWNGVRFLGQGPNIKLPIRDQQGGIVQKDIS